MSTRYRELADRSHEEWERLVWWAAIRCFLLGFGWGAVFIILIWAITL
jgi:hypothetical protein